MRLTNTGNASDSFLVGGLPGAAQWSVQYLAFTGSEWSDITPQMTSSSRWSSGPLAPSAFRMLLLRVTPAVAVDEDAKFSVNINALSVGDTAKTDNVMSETTCHHGVWVQRTRPIRVFV